MSSSDSPPSPLRARTVRFDWSNTPLHWVPDDPFTTHFINGLHLIAPIAERWFIKIYKEALPSLRDETLRAQLRGFMGQEGMHARAHDMVIEQLKHHGIDSTGFEKVFEQLCGFLAGEPPLFPLSPEAWFRWRLAMVAAGEQVTCVFGDWILRSDALDRAGADPVMLDLLRWHGAEEIEHRAVAFDVLKHVCGADEYPLRVATIATLSPILLAIWGYCTWYLLDADPTLKGRSFGVFDFIQMLAQGRAPSLEVIAALFRYLDPHFHPAQEGSLEEASAFLSRSPGVRAGTGGPAPASP